MEEFKLFAEPWWVNLTALIPLGAYLTWRRGLETTRRQLGFTALFAGAFGFVEAVVVAYLRAALGITSHVEVLAPDILTETARRLLAIEVYRETATIVVLISIALLAAQGRRERWAVFLWTFAIWDLAYYAGLWLTVRWPQSLTTPDVLFLIPVPWVSQVWFPLSVSALMVFAVLLTKSPGYTHDEQSRAHPPRL